ncbi:hypothetical protein [Rickettsia endosymbiont of Cardiosporidium cionae]|uniref:hypothetical protein n=1 Tax=Rickettsia endosymbiont of Cardiosporidium cionae TaxID=2777155 RepID=UPI001893CD39|nr:hypothetical protein [Rickettsia endosymbiont of Cardiosporidium cionae]KAF8818419.1 DNA polymerase III subunit delta' [Rickettsia endosymbiont of Cardiosporidium cionae]
MILNSDIESFLLKYYSLDSLPNVSLIETDNVGKLLEDIKKFLVNHLLQHCLRLTLHPDILVINESDPQLNITIDQVRCIKEFLYTTSVDTGHKIVIVSGVDYMNLNSANALLKTLEDIKANNYVFLLTSKMNTILPTLRSRCFELSYYYSRYVKKFDSKYGYLFLNNNDYMKRIKFIEKFENNSSKPLWEDFANNVLILICQFCKQSISKNILLSDIELTIFDQFKILQFKHFYKKYSIISELVSDTLNLDLELKASSILLFHYFTNMSYTN